MQKIPKIIQILWSFICCLHVPFSFSQDYGHVCILYIYTYIHCLIPMIILVYAKINYYTHYLIRKYTIIELHSLQVPKSSIDGFLHTLQMFSYSGFYRWPIHRQMTSINKFPINRWFLQMVSSYGFSDCFTNIREVNLQRFDRWFPEWFQKLYNAIDGFS